jgi:Spy/CpxP family protein refolding chaperone
LALAQNSHSPYAGQESREIKALSLEDIEGYLTGQGMGFAKAAELNHYPGPKHVLELAGELQLSEEQITKTKAIYSQMNKEAVLIGELIVEREKALDDLFANQMIDENQLKEMTVEIGNLRGKLRAVHLTAHLQLKKVLFPHQIDRYDLLRGYQGNESKDKHDRHMGH